MFPILCLRQALGVMLSPKVSCGILELTWTSMCITWLQFGGHTQHGQFSPACAPIGPKTAQRAQVGPVWGQPGAKLGFLPLFPTFFGFGVRARPCCPHWACLGPNFGARCPHRTKLRVLSPTCAQTCPSCAMLGPSWAQVGPKFGASYAQVGPKWATVRPNLRPRSKFDPSRLLVGASGPTSFLSVLFPGCGRFSSRSDSNRNWNRDII